MTFALQIPRFHLAIALAVGLMSGPVAADDATTSPQTIDLASRSPKDASLFSFDYGVPASPALTLAGLATAKITPSTSLKPFVLALPGLFSGSSSDTTAALDFAPGWLFGASEPVAANAEDLLNFDNYQSPSNWLARIGFRTRIGAVVYRGDDGGGDPKKAKASKLAFGISTSLLDTSDPVLASAPGSAASAWIACLDKQTALALVKPSPDEATLMHVQTLLQKLALDRARVGNPAVSAAEQKIIDYAEIALIGISAKALDVKAIANRASMTTDPRISADYADAGNALAEVQAKLHTSADALAVTAITNCQKAASQAAQHGADLELGAGLVMSGAAGSLKNLSSPQGAVWISGRLPLSSATSLNDCGDQDSRPFSTRLISCWVIGGSGRYSSSEAIATGNNATPSINARILEGWAGLERVDSNSKVGAYVGYTDDEATIPAQKSFSRSGTRWLVSAALSLDFVANGVWLEGSYGAAGGSVSTLDDKTFLLSLSLGPPKIGSGFNN